MSQAQKKVLSEVPKEIRKVYYKAFSFTKRWQDEGILLTYKKAINKLDIEIEKFNCNYNFKLVNAILLKFNTYYIKVKMAAVKNKKLDRDNKDIVKKF